MCCPRSRNSKTKLAVQCTGAWGEWSMIYMAGSCSFSTGCSIGKRVAAWGPEDRFDSQFYRIIVLWHYSIIYFVWIWIAHQKNEGSNTYVQGQQFHWAEFTRIQSCSFALCLQPLFFPNHDSPPNFCRLVNATETCPGQWGTSSGSVPVTTASSTSTSVRLLLPHGLIILETSWHGSSQRIMPTVSSKVCRIITAQSMGVLYVAPLRDLQKYTCVCNASIHIYVHTQIHYIWMRTLPLIRGSQSGVGCR